MLVKGSFTLAKLLVKMLSVSPHNYDSLTCLGLHGHHDANSIG
jgi:hypothetical protein